MESDKFILGIDLGGTKIASVVSTQAGEIVSRDYTATPAHAGPDVVIQAIFNGARRTLKEAAITPDQLLGIGIGAAGVSDPDSGIIITSPNLPGWHNVPLKNSIEKEMRVTTFLGNDANLAALGELHFGVGKGARNLIYITISTGIGATVRVPCRA